ncbi:MAG TPA: hypothetical protein VEH55_11025 [Gaiellaceae bacterium]|nr:hypothetical protein [Gaiellaceae bacterium]
MLEPEGERDEAGGERAGDDPRGQHRLSEAGASDRVGLEHEEVREVRPRKQHRRGVRHEHRAVHERPLVEPPAAGRVHEHRCEKDDGSVEIEHGRHTRDEREEHEQEAARRQRGPSEVGTDRLELPVGVDDGAGQQQARDEREGGPGLAGGG